MLRILIALMLVSQVHAQSLPTVAEATNFERTATNAEVIAFCESLAKLNPQTVRYSTYGTSQGGLPLPLLTIGGGKTSILAYANIHAGEVDGKEAVLALARELAGPGGKTLCDTFTILIAPNVNPDGNDQFSKENRKEQNGPASVGRRENGAGLDLNRDFIKLESPEIRALVKLVNVQDPLLIIDCHTTNGSHHRYTLTYDGPRYAAANSNLVAFSQNVLLPKIAGEVKTKAGFDTFPYGNFNRDRTRWETYPTTPRFGTQYFAMRNRLALLSESYSYAGYADRVKVSQAFVRAALDTAAANLDELKKIPAATGKLALKSSLAAAESPAVVLGFESDNKTPRDIRLSMVDTSVATLEVDLPAAYYIPKQYESAVHTLQRHGIVVEEIREEIQNVPVGVYRVDERIQSKQAFQNHNTATLKATLRNESRNFSPGDYLVRVDQPLGRFAAYLLEPMAEDGLATWNYFDSQSEDFPVLRLLNGAIFTGPAKALPEVLANPRPITPEVFFANQSFAGAPVGPITWLPDGKHWLQAKGGVLCTVNAVSGESKPAYDAAAFRKSLATVQGLNNEGINALLRGSGHRTDPERTGTLVVADGEFWFARFDGTQAIQLTSSKGKKEFLTLSPDGKRIAFVREGNLFSVDLETRTEIKLTSDGGGEILNARGDWVYEEEIFNRNGQAYWWSPDSKSIAYLRFDDAPVKKFTIAKPFPASGEVETYGYPKSGDPNPTVKLMVVQPGGKSRELSMAGRKPESSLISRVGWMPSGEIFAYLQDRAQTKLEFAIWKSFDAEPTVLFTDKTPAWIAEVAAPTFLKDGSFLFPSERDGWNHLYHYDASGKLLNQVTKGEWVVKEVFRVDEKAGEVYCLTSHGSPNGSNLLRCKLDGSKSEPLTTGKGTHAISVAPAGDLFVDRFSDAETPMKAKLRRFAGDDVRTLDSNPGNERGEFKFGKYERKQIPADGATLEAAITYPAKFDSAKKYPVWVLTYAGPHAPTIKDAFGTGRVFEQTLANLGIVVLRVDPRSASGHSAKSAWTCYKQLGVQELKDLETAVDWICKNDWADKDRVGISGHSFGGFITAYALTHSRKFSAGISGAPVTDWRLYDSIYTERYMGLPAENKKGYDETSCVLGASKLHGKLLLIHGLIDDNVHFQNAMQFADALQRANQPFEIMVYPKARHGIFGRHYQELQIDFIKRTMVRTPSN